MFPLYDSFCYKGFESCCDSSLCVVVCVSDFVRSYVLIVNFWGTSLCRGRFFFFNLIIWDYVSWYVFKLLSSPCVIISAYVWMLCWIRHCRHRPQNRVEVYIQQNWILQIRWVRSVWNTCVQNVEHLMCSLFWVLRVIDCHVIFQHIIVFARYLYPIHVFCMTTSFVKVI